MDLEISKREPKAFKFRAVETSSGPRRTTKQAVGNLISDFSETFATSRREQEN